MIPEIIIENRKIGQKYKPLVIAEIGINHAGNLSVAKEMVLSARRAGIEIIKHQTHIVDDEMSSEALNISPGNSKNTIFNIMNEASLDEEEELELMEFVKKNGMLFISTPFSREAFLRLEKFKVPAYKIGSGECNNYPLIDEIAKTNKPIILSTGMNSIKSISEAIKVIYKYHTKVALLHTTNLYPTPNKLVRLGAMTELANEFPNHVYGLSDHTTSNHACFGAVALGASIIERHFTDTKSRLGPDIINSMDELECSDLIKGCNILFEQRGGKKGAVKEEDVTINFAFASVCSTKKISKNEILNKSNIWVKRPGTGDFLAKDYEMVLGKKAIMDIPKNVQIKKQHIY
jgi:N-acetylneuraminate synthase